MFYRAMPINTNKDSSYDLSGSLTEDLNHISKTSSTKAMPARLIVGGIYF